jgi:membrane protein required for colicin V production
MSAFHFSYVDVVVVLIVLVSAAYAVWRGFVSETLSIFAWAAAAFAALYGAPLIAPFAHGLISPAWVATAASYVLIFLVVLIPLSFISFRFAQDVHNSPVGALDRSLGAVFGVVRGLVVVGIAYIVFSAFVPVPAQPAWITEAGTLPVIQSTAEVILSLVPDQGVKIGGNEVVRPAHRDAAKSTKTKKKTYGAADRRALDKLIEATGSGDKP